MRMMRASFVGAALLGACATTSQNSAGESHAHGPIIAVPPSSYTPPTPALDPRRGQEVGAVYEAYLSPHQEPDEEENTPSSTP